jgi:O-acetylhomoserine (thiol)-lyase
MLPSLGIEVRFAEDASPAAIAKLIDDNTKAVYCESIGNPAGNIADIRGLADTAHARGVPLIVDNTVATPIAVQTHRVRRRHSGAFAHQIYRRPRQLPGRHHSGQRPLPLGRAQGALPAAEHPRARLPWRGLHRGLRAGGLYRPRPHRALRNTGSALAPLNAFLLLQGLETLPLRMERHVDNTFKVAAFLQQHPAVAWVNYAGLPDSRLRAGDERYMGGKPSAILSFGLKGGYEAGVRCYDALKLVKRLVNIGDAKSLACHPASTTHRQLTPDELVQAGVRPEMIRLSIGIEHSDDIIADLAQALDA